jgi:hypothetical protein
MSPRSIRTVVSALLKKGFIEENSGGHRKLRLWIDGNSTKIYTFYSHGANECDDYILGRMAKHLRLTRAQFDAFIDCTLSMEAYIEILRPRSG